MPYTILVVGGNKGIGCEAVKLLSQRKPEATILLGSRSIKNGDDAIAKMKSSLPSYPFSNIKTIAIDVTDTSSISSAVDHVKSTYTGLDALVNNSGISELNGDDKHPAIFDVNVRGVKDVVEAFTPILTPKTGIVTVVSSQVGSWYTGEADPSTRAKLLDVPNASWETVEGWLKDWDTFAAGGVSKEKWQSLEGGMAASKYFASKALVNPWLRHYAATHPDVKVAVVCPGHCATELTGFEGPRTPVQGAESVIWPVLNEFESGKIYQDGVEHPWSMAMPSW